MNNLPSEKNRRVLVIDDNRAIHADFRKILFPASATAAALHATAAAVFGRSAPEVAQTGFEVESAYQGQVGVLLAAKAFEAGRPYALAFVDVRMPPGWDGVETTGKLWELDPNLQVVLCTAYSDYSWGELFEKLGRRDGLLILKKPFDAVEAFQLAHALTEKWWLHQQSRQQMKELEGMVAASTRELQWKTAFLEAQVDSSIDGILVVDHEGKKSLQNQRVADLFKIPQVIAGANDDATQVRWVTDMTKNPEQFAEKVHYLYAHPHAISRDEIELKDGTVLDQYSSPVVGKDGKYYGRIWTFRDITKSKRAEEEFRQSEESYRDLFENANDLIEIVKQLLTFGRGVEGLRVLLQPEHLIREMIKIMSGTLPKSIRVGSGGALATWPVFGDPTQLHQVLLNLCVNARDAMAQGGTLTLSAENVTLDEHYVAMVAEAKPGSYVLLRVIDTGTGISADVIDRMFEPFFTTKGIGVGTGLGLSTAMGIIKSHGGFLKVDSEIGRGTEFAVYLPAAPGRTVPEVEGESSLAPEGNGELILVVDDEPGITEVCRRTLEKHGYRVVIANDGVEALTLYAKQAGEIGAVISDLEMPFLDGIGLARAIKRMQPDARILISTAMDSSDAHNDKVAQLRDLDVTRFLTKPFNSKTLLIALHQQFYPVGLQRLLSNAVSVASNPI